MSAPLSPPAGSLLDLAAERLGATVVAASDEFFAAAENLLRASEPVFIADKYVSTGKWMDGWESRRRRTPGDDWCLIRLGLRGRIQRVVVDTRHFVGNFPEAASLEVCDVAGTPDRRALDDEKTPWREVLSRSPLRGDHPNEFFLEEPALATHLRLRIYPDGGVARLRAFGEVAPDWEWLDTSGGLVDLAGVASGGRVLDQSDMFFGSAMNMLMPYPPRDMSDGWETRRRRDAGHDWAVVALGAAGRISEIEIDTTHFRGNAPGRCRIDGGDVSPGGGAPSSWRPLLPEAPLQPHSRHVFREALLCPGAVAFLRVHIYPDGGLARLRARGRTARSEGLLIALGASQAEPLEARRQTLAACCASTAWVEGMLARGPYADVATLLLTADRVWAELGPADWLEAFAGHPRIGERAEGRAAAEQAGVAAAPAALLAALRDANRDYEERFGHIFLVCATGKSAAEMLELLRERLGGEPAEELAIAAEEQRKITRLRLLGWLSR